MTELELKFQIPPGGHEALLKAVGHRQLERVELDARYFDTADQLLARHRFAWRLRRENGRWVQTLKASTPHSVERLEHEVVLAEDAAPELPRLSLHEGSEVGARLRALLDGKGGPALVEVYRAEVVRLRRLLPYREALVEWSLDEGRIVAGDRVHPVSELELELKEGDPQALYAMGRDWQARHGLWLDTISKAHRGTLLAGGHPFAKAVKAEPPVLSRDMRGDAALRAIVAACLSQILPNAAEVAGGSEEPEHVHQLRVGLRRLRSAARELAVFGPGLGDEIESGVSRVFDALGESRDRHVLATSLGPELARAGAPLSQLPAGQAAPALAPLVRATAFQGELLRLLAWSQAEPQPVGDDKPLAVLRERLDHLRRRVARAARDFDTMSFEERHAVRKRLKRLRYLAEFAAPLFKPGRVERWNEAAAAAQDALGRHVDTALAAHHFEAAAADDTRAWFAAGWLRARLDDSAKTGAKALRRLARADAFW